MPTDSLMLLEGRSVLFAGKPLALAALSLDKQGGVLAEIHIFVVDVGTTQLIRQNFKGPTASQFQKIGVDPLKYLQDEVLLQVGGLLHEYLSKVAAEKDEKTLVLEDFELREEDRDRLIHFRLNGQLSDDVLEKSKSGSALSILRKEVDRLLALPALNITTYACP